MANPFKEAEKANKKAPGSKKEPVVEKKEVVEAETPVEPEKPVEVPVEPVVKKEDAPVVEKPKKNSTKPAQADEEKPVKDIFAGLETEAATAKTYAFYLTETNVEKLKAMAKKKGVSVSKLLDHILSEVL